MVSLPSSSSESSGEEAANQRYYRDVALSEDPPDPECECGIGFVPDKCGCGILIPVETSWKIENPGRRWVQCAKRKVSGGMNVGCGLLTWVDGKFDQQATTVINDLLRQKRELLALRADLTWDMKIREEEIKALKVKISGAGAMERMMDDLVRERLSTKESELIVKFRKQNLIIGIATAMCIGIVAWVCSRIVQ